MSVGQELLDVPLPDMVTKLALGIAEAQNALDMNSVEVAKVLADTTIEVVPALSQVVSDDSVTYTAADPIEMSLLQVSLNPTFYQFSEATIEVEMDIKVTTSTETSVAVGAKAKGGWGLWSASVSLDVKHNRKFGKEVHGTSRMITKLVPVPPPPRIYPEIITVDNRTPSQ